jgi:hypothetical protein
MGKVIRLTESDLMRLLKKVLNEQEYGEMYKSEQIIDFPEQDANSIFNSLLSNRDLTRNGQVVNQVAPKQITIKKTIQVDKNLWRTVGKNPIYLGYYGPLTFEINLLIKDNKVKVTVDNFIFNSPHPQSNWKLNPYPLNEPSKGMTQKEQWNFFKRLIDKISSEVFPVVTKQTNSDF